MPFVQIPDFPDYSVDELGRICNMKTGRIMAITRNQQGVSQVGLVIRGHQYKRSVALLVARAHLDPPYPETFDTPIHLDGDKLNNRVDNLMWRPRWFAVKYHKQFEGHELHVGLRGPIVDVHTHRHYKSSWDIARTFGLLDTEVIVCTINGGRVWPTYQEFQLLKENHVAHRR